MILTLGLIKVAVNIDECLQAHNSERALHGAAPLTWDSKLAQQAQAYALKLANIKQMKHDPNNADGENLAYIWSSGGSGYTCKEATEDW